MAGSPAGAAGGPAQADHPVRIGVLAVQGGFEAHERALVGLGCEPAEVRRPADLDGLDGLVVPGGESTTIAKGIDAYGLAGPIRGFAASGRPVLGTCAGLIVLGRAHLGLIEIEARRNAFGRQVRSFEADLAVRGLGDEPLRAVFIRAPWIERAGDRVDVLAEIDGHPVVAREDNVLVAAFHPELTDDLRMHALFLSMMNAGRPPASRRPGLRQDDASRRPGLRQDDAIRRPGARQDVVGVQEPRA